MENEEEVVVPETTEEEIVAPETTEEVVEESVEDVKAKLAKAEELAKNYKIRAEKAEQARKAVPSESQGLSSADLLAVMNAKVHEDDMERVERFAKSEGVSIKDALKNPELKAILDLRAEQRNSAEASNVSNARRSTAKIPDDVLVSKASKGDIPTDDDEIERLIAAKSKRK